MLSRRWPRLAGVAALTGVATQIGVVLLQFAPRTIPASLASARHSYDGQLLSTAILAVPWVLFALAIVAVQAGIAPRSSRVGWLAVALMVAGVICFLVAVEGAVRVVPRACYFLTCADNSYLPALDALGRTGLVGALLLGVGAVIYGVRMARLRLFPSWMTVFLGLGVGALYAFAALPLYAPFVPSVSSELQGDMPAALAGAAWAIVWLVIALGPLRSVRAAGASGERRLARPPAGYSHPRPLSQREEASLHSACNRRMLQSWHRSLTIGRRNHSITTPQRRLCSRHP